MTVIDRSALIEAAAKAISIYQGSYLYMPDTHQPIRPTTEQIRLAEAAAPVIVASVLKPLRELHHAKAYTCIHLPPAGELGPCCRHEICAACNQMQPCPTVQLLDQIESDAKGDER